MAGICTMSLGEIEARLDWMLTTPDVSLAEAAGELLMLGERTLEIWLAARGETPTTIRRRVFVCLRCIARARAEKQASTRAAKPVASSCITTILWGSIPATPTPREDCGLAR